MQIPVEKLIMEVLTLLEDRLPYYYYYHSPEHTKYVIEKVSVISKEEGVDEKDRKLLRIGALFHDIGFIRSPEDHEETGCRIVKTYLSDRGYKSDEIKIIQGMIMATKIPQNPQSDLEAILADADLEYLGTEYFKPVSDLLFKERKYFTPELTREEWNEIQKEFMGKHNYHTEYCRQHIEPVKRENMIKFLH